jgi:hypothetical protein
VLSVDEPPQERTRREELDPRRGQLNGQWQTIEVRTDPGHGLRVGIAQHEPGRDRTCPLHEQLAGRRSSDRIDGSAAIQARQLQRGDRQLVFPPQVEWSAAGHDHLHARPRRQELPDDRSGIEHLLEVVQDQQRRLVAKEPCHDLSRWLATNVPQPQLAGDRLDDQMRVGDRRQVDEPDTVVEFVDDARPELDGQACLPNTGRTGEREESDVGAYQLSASRRQIALAADDWVRLRRQVGLARGRQLPTTHWLASYG